MNQPPRSREPQEPQEPQDPQPPEPRSAPPRGVVVGTLLVLALVLAVLGFVLAPLFVEDGAAVSAPYAQGYGTGAGLSHRL